MCRKLVDIVRSFLGIRRPRGLHRSRWMVVVLIAFPGIRSLSVRRHGIRSGGGVVLQSPIDLQSGFGHSLFQGIEAVEGFL